MILLQVIICSLIGGVFSLIGGVLLLASKRRVALAEYATALAAGALLAAAFVDVLPEAIEGDDPHTVLLCALVGLLAFFIFEGMITWFHSHSHRGDGKHTDPVIPMMIIGDTVHNFIDGIAIAAGFLASPLTGVIVTIAVAAHEIPQEIGDFGLMLHKGVKRSKVLLINILSQLATTVAAVGFFLFGETTKMSFAPALGVVAGFFIYIAASDLIPSIHQEQSRKVVFRQSAILLLGVLVVSLVIVALHGLE
ncbi:MAG: ZIP family metal transporter [Candidatus Nomurabacteria bacterium]|nr:ZIP family metal transporter [Candidatus Nomurabacteria bacterium]